MFFLLFMFKWHHKVAYTSGPFFEKNMNWYLTASKMELSYFLHMVLSRYLLGFNSKDDMETSQLQFIFGKGYLRLNGNRHEISLKMVYERIY